MNARQLAFYRQAVSDWAVYVHLRTQAAIPVCHSLHYLQMCTEKLAKSYYPTALRDRHAAFRRFLTDLPGNPSAVAPLGFATAGDLTRWQLSVNQIVGAVEDLAPQIADRKMLPNPEYPWPRDAETTAPANYPFQAEMLDLIAAQEAGGESPFNDVLSRIVNTLQDWSL